VSQTTKAMQQYFAIKKNFPDTIVFFQLGDFYETFYEDAKITSKVLGITLTSRKSRKDDNNPIPLAGIPLKSLDVHIRKMVEEGYKVAIVDQLEDAKNVPSGRIVKRGVTRIVTPGTLFEPSILDNKSNNFLLSVSFNEKRRVIGFSLVDVSTGEFLVTEFHSNSLEMFQDEFTRFKPSEVIIPDVAHKGPLQTDIEEYIKSNSRTMLTPVNETLFNYDTARSTLLEHFEVKSLEGFGCESMPEGIRAAGAIINHISMLKKEFPSSIISLRTLDSREYLIIDSNTQRNLEIVGNAFDGQLKGSLLSVFTDISTSMGARLLKRWLLQPLRDLQRINERLNAIETFQTKFEVIEELRDFLREMSDFQRLMTKIKYNSANARDLLALKKSLMLSLELQQYLKHNQDLNAYICQKIVDFNVKKITEVADLLDKSIKDEPANSIREGNIIKTSFNKEIEELHKIKSGHKELLEEIKRKEEQRVKFKFKIGYNSVHGYYIEVTKAQIREAGGDKAIPEDYVRRQTLVNAERFITPELKEFEEKKLNVDEEIQNLEYQIFCEIRELVSKEIPVIREFADLLAELDVLICFTFTAIRNNYVKPQLTEEKVTEIVDGRHPVVEILQKETGFIPNTVILREGGFHIITGPNMSGKSTLIRQVAVITVMAQTGSWVPATSCKMGLCDKIFTRVGAFDRLAFGQSTFMLEMLETAHILNNSTEDSLIILDEVGRGTSTYDGLSLAWAIAEYIARKIKCRTLFATHYHQLSELEKFSKRIKNFHMTAKERNGKLMLLYKMKEGSTDHSFGISVAKMAGIPNSVILSAQKKLLRLETSSEEINFPVGKDKRSPRQLSLSEVLTAKSNGQESIRKLNELKIEVMAFLKHFSDIDVNYRTPIEALQDLEQIVREMRKLQKKIEENF